LKETPSDPVASSPEEDFDVLFRSATVSRRHGDLEAAINQLEKALERQPMHFDATCELAACLFDAGFKALATKRFERALLIKPGSTWVLYSLAVALMHMNQLGAAKRRLSQLLEREPGHIDACLTLASIEQTLGSDGEADKIYRRVLADHPQSAKTWYAWVMQRQWRAEDPEIPRFLLASDAADHDEDNAILFGYARGKLYDDLGDYERAMHSYQEANRRQARQQCYDYHSQVDFFSRYRDWQSRDRLRTFEAVATADATPVFVVGMPRSGTSLVEQILASHSGVAGAGEVAHSRILEIACEQATGRPFPESVDAVAPGVIGAAARTYLERLRASVSLEADSGHRIVDKLPHNFLRVGLLATLFPNASFVLCERNPLDVCLSIYRQRFSDTHGYACDLAELGRYYQLYRSLMQYWEAEFPGRFYRLSYEALVADAPGQVREMLDGLGLAFEQSCLDYHQTRRFVATPSAVQVRRSLYRGSVGHWRHYSGWLDPLRAALDEGQA
jgi:tetratricopeptide (TPR) repeat protein